MQEFTYSKKGIVAIIAITIVVSGALSNLRAIDENIEYFLTKYFSQKKLSREELKEEALELSQRLFEFIEVRKKYLPWFDFKNPGDYMLRLMDFNAETRSIYFLVYYSELDEIRLEFLKYDISNEDFSRYMESAKNILEIESVAQILIQMADQL